MTALVIWTALGVAWLWHVAELFRPIDPAELPPRARERLGRRDEKWPVEPIPLGLSPRVLRP